MYTLSIVILFGLYMASNNGQYGVSNAVGQVVIRIHCKGSDRIIFFGQFSGRPNYREWHSLLLTSFLCERYLIFFLTFQY